MKSSKWHITLDIISYITGLYGLFVALATAVQKTKLRSLVAAAQVFSGTKNGRREDVRRSSLATGSLTM